MKDKWQTKARIIWGLNLCLPAFLPEGFSRRRSFTEEKALFPSTSRRTPEDICNISANKVKAG